MQSTSTHELVLDSLLQGLKFCDI